MEDLFTSSTHGCATTTMNQTQAKNCIEYQRFTWNALRKSITGLLNKVDPTNIKNVTLELLEENLIQGRGLFCRACIKSQVAAPGFTDVFALLVAVINSKFPQVGKLLLKRVALIFKKAYKHNDKVKLLASVTFIAHLVNLQVVHEIIALELIIQLLEFPSDDSVEVATLFVKECGYMLQDLSPRGVDGVFERFREILHEGEISKPVQFLIESLFAIRKAKFLGYPAFRAELDLVEQGQQLTHKLSFQDDEIDPEIDLEIFKPDPEFLENERRYEELKKEILGDKEESNNEDESCLDDFSDEEEEEEEPVKIGDESDKELVNLRSIIYLTITSSLCFEDAGNKLLQIKPRPGQEIVLCSMIVECCTEEKTYNTFYGNLGQRFCMISKVYQENFEKCFVDWYLKVHRLETNKLLTLANFFAHLLSTDALSRQLLGHVRLTEEDTTSSSRIFIKYLFQELSGHVGINMLNKRLSDPTMQDVFESIFPRDSPVNARFSINFFTAIGLGGITDNLRQYLKSLPGLIKKQRKLVLESEDSESDHDRHLKRREKD